MLLLKNYTLKPYDTNKEDGFTLIELLVVILIIGILTAIAVPVFLNQRKVAVDSTVESDMVNASLAVETWNVDNGGKTVAIPDANSQLAKDIKLSSGNSVTIVGNSSDYCITGTNPQGKQSAPGMTYSSLKGGLNKGGSCAGFVPTSSPAVNGTLTLQAPDVTTVVIPPVTAAENVATCGVITLTSTAGTWITCAKSPTSNGYHDSFDIKVGTTSSTPIKWDVAVDIQGPKQVKTVAAWAVSTFDNLSFTTPKFSIKGTDRSWNGDPKGFNNYSYTSDTKTNAFSIGITWK